MKDRKHYEKPTVTKVVVDFSKAIAGSTCTAAPSCPTEQV